MAELVYGMNMSLDGYVDHDRFAPDDVLFRHFIDQVAGQSALLYGRGLYEIMTYWDADQEGADADHLAYRDAWRAKTKYVASRGTPALGPNAVRLGPDLAAEVRRLNETTEGQIGLGGPNLAAALAPTGLIDRWWIYLHPVVLVHGRKFFPAAPPQLRLTDSERIGDGVIRLTYRPA